MRPTDFEWAAPDFMEFRKEMFFCSMRWTARESWLHCLGAWCWAWVSLNECWRVPAPSPVACEQGACRSPYSQIWEEQLYILAFKHIISIFHQLWKW